MGTAPRPIAARPAAADLSLSLAARELVAERRRPLGTGHGGALIRAPLRAPYGLHTSLADAGAMLPGFAPRWSAIFSRFGRRCPAEPLRAKAGQMREWTRRGSNPGCPAGTGTQPDGSLAAAARRMVQGPHPAAFAPPRAGSASTLSHRRGFARDLP